MIHLSDVSFSYNPGAPVLDSVSLEIQPGLNLLLGPNGSGKSSLLKIIAGVESPSTGVAQIEGLDLWKDEVAARKNLAYVPEQPDLTPYATIRDVLRFVCRLRAQPLSTVDEVIDRAGLSAASSRSIRELSMGQRRRVMLAAAWIGDPKVVILDEPLESMDRGIAAEIIAWVEGLEANGACVVVATHDIEPFAARATRAISVRGGRCTVHPTLPADQVERLALLDACGKGV